jgi:hypothetical protein
VAGGGHGRRRGGKPAADGGGPKRRTDSGRSGGGGHGRRRVRRNRAAGVAGVAVCLLLAGAFAAGAAFALAAFRHGRRAGGFAWRAAGLVLGAGAVLWLAALAGFAVKRFVHGTDGSVLQAMLLGDGWPLLLGLAALLATALGEIVHGVALAGRR